MSETFIGDIRLFGFGFTPRGWAPCQGQTLSIQQNQALFAIIGATYGGDGATTFKLPDLRGRAPVHTGNGVTLGQSAGEEKHTLTVNEMPTHTHTAMASEQSATSYTPVGNTWAPPGNSTNSYSQSPDSAMSPGAIAQAGGSAPHSNMQPYLAMNYCICVNGYFPTRE
ncbi:phage tail protein [Paenibacillus arenilitoris]|uniref:Phage tail protein n=1 Tax=Paenibacillus arenilitoris TaxID=2772299 RepID=A0A927CIJ0_9BACL|nr:tail fiber protein [Paenibacillus arenilitoris]MBD2867717.1 phage tail protein [Paenibacillus arenilitoris]